jgi:phage replication initiation protein
MKANVLTDWLSFTLRCAGYEDKGERFSSGWDDVRVIIEDILRLPLDIFMNMERGGRYGYRYGVAYNGIEIYYGGSGEMGACCSMSGNACRVYDQRRPMMELLRRLHDDYLDGDVNITRIDLAVDDHAGHMNIRRVECAIRDGEIRTNVRRKRLIIDLDQHGHEEGNTIYIGSEKSESRFRIYDKAKEQGDYRGVWNRLELVSRRENAAAVVDALVTSGDDFGATVAGIIADKLAFINKDDSNISRCSLQAWWVEFLELVSRIKLMFKRKPALAVEKLAAFLGEEMSACFWACVEVYGLQFLDSVIKRGAEKAGKRHRRMVDDYRLFAEA